MSEDRERVLRMALKAVLFAAQECCVDIDQLTELAIQSMYGGQLYNPADMVEATVVIEVAADALPAIH
ncbi:MAG: hypothetical protein ACRYF8_12365 [Janthinobacterium lividum]